MSEPQEIPENERDSEAEESPIDERGTLEAERIAEALGVAGGRERQACGGRSQCVGIPGDGGH